VLESPASTTVEVPIIATRELSAVEVVALEFTASLLSPDRRVSFVTPLALCAGSERQSRQYAQRIQP